MQNEDVRNKRKRRTQEEPVEETLHRSDELPFDEALVPSGPIVEVSLEALYDDATDPNNDLAIEELIDTKHSDGSTSNPQQAWEQGLVYTPPDAPPILPSDDFQNAQIAAGFAQSLEEDSDENLEELPNRVNHQDLDLEDDIRDLLRTDSQTTHLDVNKLEIHINHGMVYLYGAVFSDDDIETIERLIRDLDGVRDVENFLEIENSDETNA